MEVSDIELHRGFQARRQRQSKVPHLQLQRQRMISNG
jgi:hypothetical protein